MKTILRATATILAFAAPALAAEPTKTEPSKIVGDGPASL